LERGDSSAVGRGRAGPITGPITTNNTPCRIHLVRGVDEKQALSFFLYNTTDFVL